MVNMAKKKQPTEAQLNKQKRSGTNSTGITHSIDDMANLTELIYRRTEVQVPLLTDKQLPIVQRRTLAGQIGEMQGNQYLHRMISPLKQDVDGNSIQTSINHTGLIQRVDAEQRDEFEANMVRADLARLESLRTDILIYKAQDLDRRLQPSRTQVILDDGTPANRPIGPRTQIEIARVLIKIYEILDARIQEAPLDENGLPQVEGFEWNPSSPLAGMLEDISPFGNIDYWYSLTQIDIQPQEKPRRAARRQRQNHRKSEEQSLEDHRVNIDQSSTPGASEGQVLIEQIPEPDIPTDISGELTTVEWIVSLLGEILESVSLALVAAAISAYGLFRTFQEADKRTTHGSKVWGIKLGLLAVSSLSLEDHILYPLTVNSLESRIKSNTSWEHIWRRQILFSEASGPDLALENLRAGLREVANKVNGAVRRAENTHLQYLRQNYPEEQAVRIFQQQINGVRQIVYGKLSQTALEKIVERTRNLNERP